MKKYGVYSVLLAAVLFAGCTQKNDVMMDSDSQNNNEMKKEMQNPNSESKMEKMDAENETMKSSSDMMSSDDNQINGNYLMVAGKKVFVENLYFAFDKYNLDDSNRELAKSNAAKLSSLDQNTKIKLEGNSDEWGTDEYNYALALKRAKSAKDALIADGISSSSITMVSFGESNPTCTDKTVECWKQNRRVEYKLLP
jgi:peptidoglycan-associated lipoprotein